MLRKITIQDKQLYLEMARAFYTSEAVNHHISDENFENTFTRFIADDPYAKGFIIEHENQIVGYITLALTYSTEANGMVVWLEEIYIKPDFRGKGIGNSLLNEIEQMFHGQATRFRLEVDKCNSGAKRLYEKFGFKDMYYTNMYKDLS